jgi:hypothetical protein
MKIGPSSSSSSSSSCSCSLDLTVDQDAICCNDLLSGSVNVNTDCPHAITVTVTPSDECAEESPGTWVWFYSPKPGDCGTTLNIAADANSPCQSVYGAADIVKIEFDQTLVKTGYKIIDDKIVPIKVTVKATITPKSSASKVSFTCTNDTRAAVTESGRQDSGNSTIVSLEVGGLSATPATAPQGDAALEAAMAGKSCKSIPIVVYVPKTQSHDVPPTVITNGSSIGTAASKCEADFTICIKDQFGNKLVYPFYEGADAVVEQFGPTTGSPFYGDIFTHTKKAIIVPSNQFLNGEIKDAAGLPLLPALPQTALNAADQAKWEAFTYRIPAAAPNWDNSFATFVSHSLPVDCEAVQSIWVWGHAVSPNYLRKFMFKAAQHNADAAKITETEQ